QRIDVGDEPAEQVAGAQAREAGGRERHEPLVDAGTHGGDEPKRHVVRSEPPEGAAERAPDPGETHAHERDRHAQEFRRQRRLADQVAGGREEAEARPDRAGAEQDGERDASRLPLPLRKQEAETLHAAAPSSTRVAIRPFSSATIRSARRASLASWTISSAVRPATSLAIASATPAALAASRCAVGSSSTTIGASRRNA